jgi:hypothetical protein
MSERLNIPVKSRNSADEDYHCFSGRIETDDRLCIKQEEQLWTDRSVRIVQAYQQRKPKEHEAYCAL